MPRKQRFKPSRKPKPPVVDGTQPESMARTSSQDLNGAEPTRSQQDTSSVIEAEESPK
jgi:hypothetical protein